MTEPVVKTKIIAYPGITMGDFAVEVWNALCERRQPLTVCFNDTKWTVNPGMSVAEIIGAWADACAQPRLKVR